MNLRKRLQEIEARKAEIRGLLENDEKADLDALEKEPAGGGLQSAASSWRGHSDSQAGHTAGGRDGRRSAVRRRRRW